MPEWTSDIAVSPQLAESLITSQFPALAPMRLERFGEGWDNCAYLVNQTCVFRFPRRQLAVPFLRTEMRLLPAIAHLVSLPVPAAVFFGKECALCPYPFAGYPLIPGQTACRAVPSDAARVAIAPVLGSFLRKLHSISAELASSFGARTDTLGRLDVIRRRPKGLERLDYLVAHHLLEDVADARLVLNEASEVDLPESHTLVHGDLYSRHLLLDRTNHLAGIIDWGDVHIGDAAADLMVAFTFLPPAARPAFWDAYGPATPKTLRLARFRAICHSATVAAYAHCIADSDLLRESLLSIGHATQPDVSRRAV
jgi:aminoglycoside phosphotransferase (APT) family kinase protein